MITPRTFPIRSLLALFTLSLLVLACEKPESKPSPETKTKKPETSTAPKAPKTQKHPSKAAKIADAPTRYPAPKRLVAFGDVHGDLQAMKDTLRIAKITDASGQWIAGDAVVVQTGDLLDRGDDEIAIMKTLEDLAMQADKAGGKLVRLNGNHEIMNVMGDFRYVTPGAMQSFQNVQGLNMDHPLVQRFPEHMRHRAAAFLPGGPYAMELSKYNIAVVVGDTAFVHGGIRPEFGAQGLETINQEAREWMQGKRDKPPAGIVGQHSLIWSRDFSDEAEESDCQTLQRSLDALGARRMVVGHTVQKGGITSACDGRVWRIDVGMARHYGGRPQALQIENDKVEILSSAP